MRIPVNLSVTGLYGAGILGGLLWLFPADPDANFSHVRVAGVFLLTVFFLGSIWGWGRLFSRLTRLQSLEPLSSLALGSAAAALLIGLLGHLGWLGLRWSWPELLLMAAGGWVGRLETHHRPARIRMRSVTSIALLVTLICIGMRVLIASVAQGTTDPFIYHLLAPRYWWDQGRILVPPFLPVAFQSTYWEYLIEWGNIIFAGPLNRGLIELHLFGQFIHVLLGLGGSALALGFLARRLTLSRAAASLFALLGISSLILWQYTWLAKNDMGAVFWSLTAIVIAFSDFQLRPRRRWVWAGLFAGLAMAAKLNMGFLLLPALSLKWALELRHAEASEKRRLFTSGLIGALCACAAMMPILVRNVIFTHNPFFPFFETRFPSGLISKSMMEGTPVTVGPAKSLEDWAYGFGLLLSDNPLSFAIVALLPSVFWQRRRRALAPLAVLVISASALLVLYSSRKMDPISIRWISPSLVLLPSVGFACLVVAIRRASARIGRRFAHPAMAALYLVSSAGLLFAHAYKNYPFLITSVVPAITPNLTIRDDNIHCGGSAKAWLRLHSLPTDLIFSTGDDQIFYLTGYRVRILSEEKELDAQFFALKTPEAMVKALVELHGRYLLDTEYWFYKYWGRSAFLLNQLIEKYPASIVFQGYRSKVVDIAKLEELSRLGASSVK